MDGSRGIRVKNEERKSQPKGLGVPSNLCSNSTFYKSKVVLQISRTFVKSEPFLASVEVRYSRVTLFIIFKNFYTKENIAV